MVAAVLKAAGGDAAHIGLQFGQHVAEKTRCQACALGEFLQANPYLFAAFTVDSTSTRPLLYYLETLQDCIAVWPDDGNAINDFLMCRVINFIRSK